MHPLRQREEPLPNVMGPDSPTGLPIEPHLPSVEQAVVDGPLVLTAAPGAGKSSLVPFAVRAALGRLHAEGNGRVVMLQPRRLAARATASRLAMLLDEPLGGSIGLTMRGERVEGRDIEVATEAILTNRLHRDPELAGIGAVIFDEFHERNLHSDIGLAMALEAREALRPDLRIVVMSATIDPVPIAHLLGEHTTVIDVEGRVFPIETEHRQRPTPSSWPDAVAAATIDASNRVGGDVLVFAPGKFEIDAVVERVSQRIDGSVVALHGSSPAEVHRSVLQASDQRRVIVATAIAETSITIPGIEAVVDGGLTRRPRHDPATATNHLVTDFVSRFSADQRRGRAGRTQPGICIRMWSAADHALLSDQAAPEITDGDPIQIAAELLRWGDDDGEHLALINRPDPKRLATARTTMRWWGITDGQRTTDLGHAILSLPVHPRIGALLAAAVRSGDARLTAVALEAAAVLEDSRFPTNDDFEAEVKRRRTDAEIVRAIRRLRPLLDRLEQVGARERSHPESLAHLLAMAWPDRIALPRRDDAGRLLMANGREVRLEVASMLTGSEAFVVVDTTVVEASGRVRRAVPLERSDITRFHEPTESDIVEWDRSDKLVASKQRRHGAITLHREPMMKPPPDAVQRALRVGLQQRGLDVLRWSEKDQTTRRRLAWLHEQRAEWPDVSDEVLLGDVDRWLDLGDIKTIGALRSVSVGAKLLHLLDWQQRRAFDELAPLELQTPAGRWRRIDWSGDRPTWPVRVQDLFGLDDHPTIGPNEAPLTIELLSPAGRTTQTTTDLPGFWRGSYAAVRADLRGRYPKHAWPEDPLKR